MKKYYKVISRNKSIWYGTYKTKKEAQKRLNEFPKEDLIIVETK